MMNRLRNGDLDALKVKAVLTNTQNREKKVKNEFKKNATLYFPSEDKRLNLFVILFLFK